MNTEFCRSEEDRKVYDVSAIHFFMNVVGYYDEL